MTSPEWWAASKRPVSTQKSAASRTKGLVWTLYHGRHVAALDLRLIGGYGAEITLMVNAELRRSRFYHRTRVIDMVDAIGATEATLERRGWIRNAGPEPL
jgi:hypothetical protein